MPLKDRKASRMFCRCVFSALIPILCIVFLFSACGNDPVKSDLINYLDVRLPKIISLETEAGTDFSNVTGNQYKGDTVMLQALDEKIIPKYSKFLADLKLIKPKTDEVKAIQVKYVEGATEINNGFIFLAEGLRKRNENTVMRGNAMVDAGARKIREVNGLIGELARKHDIAINTVMPEN